MYDKDCSTVIIQYLNNLKFRLIIQIKSVRSCLPTARSHHSPTKLTSKCRALGIGEGRMMVYKHRVGARNASLVTGAIPLGV